MVRVLLPHFGQRIQSVLSIVRTFLLELLPLALPDLFVQRLCYIKALSEVDEMPHYFCRQNKCAVDQPIQCVVPKAPVMGKGEQHHFQQNCVQEGAGPPCTIAQFFAGGIDEKGQHTDGI